MIPTFRKYSLLVDGSSLIIVLLNSFGLSFLGPAWSEANLIGYAYAFEQRTMVRDRVQPYILPTTELVNVVKSPSTNASSTLNFRRLGRY